MIAIRPWYTRQRRKLLWTAALLCLYAALGFLLLPWLVKTQTQKVLSERLDVQAQIGKVRFNPFTFTFAVDNFDATQGANGPLLQFSRVFVNFDPLRLVLLRYHFAEVSIDDPALYFARASQSDNTLTRLLQRWQATAEPDSGTAEAEPEQAGSLPPLELRRFAINNGSFHYSDAVPPSGFNTTITPINISVDDFSLLEEHEGSKIVSITLEENAMLTWQGGFSVDPLQGQGTITLRDFSLATPYRYVQDSLPFSVDAGRLALSFNYRFALEESGPGLTLSELGVALSALALNENDDTFLAAERLALDGGTLLYPQRTLTIAELRLDGVQTVTERNAQGELNWLRLLQGLPGADREAAPAQPSAPAWTVSVNRVALQNSSASIQDATPARPFVAEILTEAELQGFSTLPATRMPLHLALNVQSGGTLQLDGDLQLAPDLQLAADLRIDALALALAEPYLQERAQLDIEQGQLQLEARLDIGNDEPFALQGNLALADLSLHDSAAGETFASLALLSLNNIDFSLARRQLALSTLQLDAPYARVFIDANGVSNIGTVFGSNGAAAEQEQDELAIPAVADEAAAAPFALSIGELRIAEGQSHFTDENLPIVFDTRMHGLAGSLSGFATGSSQPVNLQLEGQVDEYGLVQIDGSLNPFAVLEQTEVNLQFSNLNLPAMSPYVIKFAGREIADGRMDVGLTYAINASQLVANNAVIMRDLALGAKVEHPDAMDLPLDLAVALLEDANGVIDLQVPVSGNVDDPQFSYGPVIRRAIFNVITGLVTAPFRLLANLVGGGEDAELDQLRFQPGRADLAPPELEKLDKLAAALAQRPQLVLQVPAVSAGAADAAVLRRVALDARIAATLAADGAAATAQVQDRRLVVLESLYDAAMLLPARDELRQQFMQTATEENAAPVFDALSYAAALDERLLASETVDSAALEQLGTARQQAVLQYLAQQAALDANRVQAGDLQESAVEAGWLQMELGVTVPGN